jgi:hypothetical protein
MEFGKIDPNHIFVFKFVGGKLKSVNTPDNPFIKDERCTTEVFKRFLVERDYEFVFSIREVDELVRFIDDAGKNGDN